MKLNPMRMALPLVLSLLSGQAILAGPLQRNQVAGEAVWFLHLDVDRFKQAKLGQHLLTELEKPQVQSSFGAFQALMDFDPKKKLQACTLYSRGVTPEDSVLLLQGDFETERLVNVAEIGQDHRRDEYRAYTVHNWIENTNPLRNQPRRQTRTYGAMHTNRVIVLGQRFARVTEALDVLDGLHPSLARTNEFNQTGLGSGAAFLQVVARLTDIAQLAPQAAMLKQVKRLNFQAAETEEGKLTVDMRLEAENEDAAKTLVTISQGFLALATMQQANQPQLAKMLKSISTLQTNSTVTSSLSFPSADLIQVMKGAAPEAARPR